MFQFLRQLARTIRNAWPKLDAGARVNLVLATLATLVAVAAVVYFLTRPQYVTLYSRLSLEDSSEIVAWLESHDFPYRLQDGGRTVEVAARSLTDAKVGLAGQKLPTSQGSVPGFELYEDRSLLASQYLRDVGFMRALNGELQRQLNEFDFIRNSSVFISHAQDRHGASGEEPSQAAITVDVAGGMLSPLQRNAILHTVTTFGGARLTPANVSIVGTDGTIFHSPGADPLASMAGTKLAAQAEWEHQKEAKLRDMFRPITTNSAWAVNVVLDWTQVEKKSREYSDGIVTNVAESNTTRTTRLDGPAGAPGARANLPDDLAAGPGPVLTTEETTEFTEQTAPNSTSTTTVLSPGRIKRVSVSGIIEGGYERVLNEAGAETGEWRYTGIPGDRLTEFKQIVVNAVGEGITPEDILLTHAPFRTDALTAPAAAAPLPAPWWRQRWFQVAIQLMLIGLALLAVRWFMQRAIVVPAAGEETIVDFADEGTGERRRREIAAEVERLSEEEPEVVAALLRSWMAEEEY